MNVIISLFIKRNLILGFGLEKIVCLFVWAKIIYLPMSMIWQTSLNTNANGGLSLQNINILKPFNIATTTFRTIKNTKIVFFGKKTLLTIVR